MSKWKCEICGNEFENFHAQGFDRKIYCPLCYFKKENQELNNKINELVKYAFGTDMSLGEFKGFYKLATGKDYDPKKCPEVE